MPTYRQSVGDNITYLQQQLHRQGTAPLGPVSVEPGEGYLRFNDGSADTFVAQPSGAQVRFRGGLQGLTDRLENDATSIEDHTKLLGDHIRRLNTVDGRLDGHDTTLTSHGNRLGSAESRLSGHDSAIASHNTRINNAQDAANTANSRAGSLEGRASTLESNISSHNTRINNAQSAANTANSRASSLESRASTLESNISSHNTRINNAQSAANAARTRADNAYALAQDALAAGNDAKRLAGNIDTWLRRYTGYPTGGLNPNG